MRFSFLVKAETQRLLRSRTPQATFTRSQHTVHGRCKARRFQPFRHLRGGSLHVKFTKLKLRYTRIHVYLIHEQIHSKYTAKYTMGTRGRWRAGKPRMAHRTADKLVYCHESPAPAAVDAECRMECGRGHVERWESDEDSEHSEGEDEANERAGTLSERRL